MLWLRRTQGITQKTAAALMGVSVRTYSRYETGASVPRVGEPLLQAAEVLRVSPMFLMYGTEGDDDDNERH
jgi:transcriptional regulator with XRE-family HTH domain